jgi:hypothetical protein
VLQLAVATEEEPKLPPPQPQQAAAGDKPLMSYSFSKLHRPACVSIVAHVKLETVPKSPCSLWSVAV